MLYTNTIVILKYTQISWKIVTKGARLAIVAGILIAIAGGATVAAVSTLQTTPDLPGDNANNTNSEPRKIVVELNESLSVDAK